MRCVVYIFCSLAKYREHFTFLKDAKFLEDLENDSVDSDIIDEELSALHQVPIRYSTRHYKSPIRSHNIIVLSAICGPSNGVIVPVLRFLDGESYFQLTEDGASTPPSAGHMRSGVEFMRNLLKLYSKFIAVHK